MSMTAGALLRQYRERRGMTQYDAELLYGIPRPSIVHMELGARRIASRHLEKIIPALDLAVDEIEDIIRAVSEERTADLDALLDREYVRLIPHGIRKGVTA